MADQSLDLYVCIDIEVDGFSPGHHSMMSFAAVAFTPDKQVLGTLVRNLFPLAGAKQDPEVMKFWAAHPDAFAATQVNRVTPAVAMSDLRQWALGLPVPEGGERCSSRTRRAWTIALSTGTSKKRTWKILFTSPVSTSRVLRWP